MNDKTLLERKINTGNDNERVSSMQNLRRVFGRGLSIHWYTEEGIFFKINFWAFSLGLSSCSCCCSCCCSFSFSLFSFFFPIFFLFSFFFLFEGSRGSHAIFFFSQADSGAPRGAADAAQGLACGLSV
jgi:hypothetical protein